MAGEWYEGIPSDMTVEHQGQQVPLRDHSFIKEAKDLPSFAKSAFDAHREVGSRIPVKISKPEDVAAWKKEHLPKLYTAGILEAPPDAPEKYEIKRSDDMPEGLWNEEYAKEFGTTLHKHGIPKSAVPDLLALHNKAVLGARKTIETSNESAMAALKAEHGDKFSEREEMSKRLIGEIFKTPEELAFFEEVGLGNHPGFLSVIMRLAPLAQQDSSFIKDGKAGVISGEDVRTELADIMSNPKNEHYEGYRRGDPKALAHVEGLYKKAYGDGKVTLGEGITIDRKPA